MRAALLIAAKDLRQRLRDRSALLLALVLPLALSSIFAATLHDVIGGHVSFPVALVDADRGPAARAFSTEALAPLAHRGLLDVRAEPTLAAGRRAVDRGSVLAAFVLPAGFSAALAGGRAASIGVVGSADDPIGVQVAQAVAQAYADRAETARIAAAATGSAPDFASIPQPVRVVDVSTASRQLDAATFYAAGMAVFFLFFTVQLGVTSILDERSGGTLARLLAAPVARGAVLAGKLLTSLVLGGVSMAVLAVATRFLLGARWGDPLGVAILIVCGVLAATAVMALVATLARDADQAATWQSMVALVLGMLGGTFFPVAAAGGVLAALSLATPQAWFLRGIDDLAGGAGPGAALGPAGVLLAFAAAVGGVALLRAGRLVDR